MRTLSMGLFAEGATDPDFFSSLLVRVAVGLIRSGGQHAAEVAEPLVLPGRPSSDTFVSVIQRYSPACNLIVVHADGNGDPDRAIADRIKPWFASTSSMRPRAELVPVVPVRETEAWMLADIDALQRVLGTDRTKADLGLPPRTRGVEHLADPKSTLKSVLVIALGERRARKVGVRPLYGALGAETSINELRNVPAFASFEVDFRGALATLGFVNTDRSAAAS